jgi:pimeloyl-ACP methyl ester carboxylesterase
MAKALVDGVQLSYRQLGAGPDVVLVHGAGANMAFWRMELLRSLAGRFRVTVYDLRGHGYSDMPASGYTTAHMAADLAGLLDHLGVERAHLVGHSFGGGTALHTAVLHPARVATLTLADAKVSALQPPQRVRDWPGWERTAARLRELGIEIGPEEMLDARLLEVIARPEWQRARERFTDVDALFLPFAGWNGGRRAAERWLALMAHTTARDELGATAGLTAERIREVTRPVLAVYGEHSHCLATLEGLDRLLRDCRTAISPGVGHFHPVVKAGVFAAHLEGFLTEHTTEVAAVAARGVTP